MIESTYGCPQIIYVPFVSVNNVQVPKASSVSTEPMRDFDPKLVHARSFKIRSIQHCPFKQTLYLDNDINIVNVEKVLDWFTVMEQSKKCISMKNDHAIHKGHFYHLQHGIISRHGQHTIHERNTGIMYLMCDRPIILDVLAQWEYAYFNNATFDYHDQGPWITVLDKYHKFGDRIIDLPEIYNCRYDLFRVQNRSSCYLNHVKETHYGKPIDPEIVGPRNCSL